MAGNDDQYFGFDHSWLSAVSTGDKPYMIGGKYEPTYYSQTWDGDQPSDPTYSMDETKAADDSANASTIEMVNLELMGEQPGTSDDLSMQWGKLGLMLAGIQLQLRTQTQTMAEGWDSPAAKEVYLLKVGEMLAYLDVWQYASSVNSVNLANLASLQREAQDKMRTLWAEWQKAKSQSITNEIDLAGIKSAMSGYEQEQDRKAGKLGYQNRSLDENHEDFNHRARVLASEIATTYAPIIQDLRGGHAMIMEPFNAHIHPGAFGTPIPSVSTPGAPPGAPGAPGGSPPSTSAGPVPSFAKNAPSVPDNLTAPTDGPPVAPNATPPAVPSITDVPNVPEVGAGGGPMMVPPAVQPPPVPNMLQALSTMAPFLANPNLSVPNVLKNMGKNLPNVQPPSMPDTLGGGSTPGGTPPAGAADLENLPNSLSTQNGMYPPGTITPPPGGSVPQEQQKQQGMPGSQLTPPPGSSMGQSPQSRQSQRNGAPAGRGPGSQLTPPPGSSMGQNPQSRQGMQDGSAPAGVSPELADAFRPPPASTPSVLGNESKRRVRPGSLSEGIQSEYQGLGGATPPVLGNPRREGAGKGMGRRPRPLRKLLRRDKKLQPHELSEFLSGLPAATAPVLEGRVHQEPVESVGEVPSSLLAPKHALPEPDKHARPVEHADRTTRVAHQPATGQPDVSPENAWEVENPGGPMVAGHTPAKHNQVEATPLDNRSTS
ncbi:hypothetical protein FPZ12_018230 [Amycolatopsis acidicola]|uniref:Uncharacterized protein n=1 Tax=Amycolatopsis acidicola TaxID=2596893 RepID=A0A5N0V2V9_9PSEU|nr:hypothetical protein [Amycolatopsis acidicola]KAA9160154.1 hypothetical protein FPZ12_018230 [Amycolatopsis acidicola]